MFSRMIFLKSILMLSAFGQPNANLVIPTADGINITADVYMVSQDLKTPTILLCHQAGWSRGEYREIAPKLNALGFNCVAIDQRSGKATNNVKNETAHRAEKAGKPTGYVDALPDIEAAIVYLREHHAKGKLIIWGSSYSAALVLKIAGDHPEWIDGVLAFAPGEYFRRAGKPGDWISQSAKNIKDPAFITSAKNEKQSWWPIYQVIPEKLRHYFLPESAGNHVSRALWERFDDSAEYWAAVKDFLVLVKSE